MVLSCTVFTFKNCGGFTPPPKPRRSYAYDSTINIRLYCTVLGKYFTHGVLDNTEYLMLCLVHYSRS